MWWFISPKIVFGEDALEYLKEIDGKKAFLVTDKVMRNLGFVEQVVNYLKEGGFDAEIFDEVEAEPSLETCERGAEMMRKYKPDWVIGLGGGSAMDAAKAMWVLYEREDLTFHDINPFAKLGLRKKARFLTIPTTSGTGADVTWAVVLTDTNVHKKVLLASREVIADVAIVDPSLPLKMPPKLTSSTGLDALTHAVEAYVSTWRNDYSDGLAIKTIQIVFDYLIRAVTDGTDQLAREKMHNAATLGGLAFGNSQVGIAHSMGHSFGALFKIPHGRAVGLFLPYSIEYNAKEVGDRYADIAKSIGIDAENDDEAVEKLVDKIRTLTKEIGEVTAVKDLGIDRDDYISKLQQLIDNANEDSCTVMNPRVPSNEDFEKLYMYAYEGKKIDF